MSEGSLMYHGLVSPTTVDAPRPRRASSLPPDQRRSMIVTATLPLLLRNGEMVTTRQIAEAAGIAEGTIFRVFVDKDALIAAVVDAALDVGPLEQAIAAIDPTASLDAAVQAAIVVIQQRVVDIWRLFSTLGRRFADKAARPPVDIDALVSLLDAHRAELTVEPRVAARLLRALTLAASHPMLTGEPMAAAEIVALFLHGVAAGAAAC